MGVGWLVREDFSENMIPEQDEEKEGEIEDEKRPKRQANQMQTCLDPNSNKKITRRTK